MDIRSGIPGLPVAYLEELNNALALVPVPDQQTEEEAVMHWGQLPNRDTVTTFKVAQVAVAVFLCIYPVRCFVFLYYGTALKKDFDSFLGNLVHRFLRCRNGARSFLSAVSGEACSR